MLKHDGQGFLVGERLDSEEITGRLEDIREEIHLLRRELMGSAPRHSVPAQPERPSRLSSVSSVGTPQGSTARAAPAAKAAAAVPAPRRGGNDEERSPAVVPARAARAPQVTERGANGRFIGRGGDSTEGTSDYADDEGSGAITGAIEDLGNRISGAVQEVGAGTEEADPALKAFNEVARPLSRGFNKLAGSGEDRKRERWYRRFWTMMRDSNREDSQSNRRQLKTLKNIERKPGAGKGSVIWRALMFLAAPLMGMFSLIAGLPIAIAGALAAVLKTLLTSVGLGAIAKRIPGGAARIPKGVGGAAGGAARAGAGRGLFRRIPIIGAAIGAGMMARDVLASERGGGTRQEKDVTTGRAIGGGVGGIGGMAAGAAAGAAVGSVIPIVGTTIGGIIGAVAGGYFGGSAGEVVGGAVGGWVAELRDSNFMQSMVDSWDYMTKFSASLWRQTSEAVTETWQDVSESVREGWSRAADALSETWGSLKDAISERWNSVTDAMASAWEGAVSLVSGVWEGITGVASGINSWVAEKTGFNIAESAKTAFDGAKDMAAATMDKVSDLAVGVWGGIKNGVSSAIDSVGNAVNGAVTAAGNTAPGRAIRTAHFEAKSKPALVQAMADAGITNANEQAAFMGQMHHESAGFTQMEESFKYRSADRIMAVSKTARGKGQAEVERAMAQGPEAVAELMYGGRMGNKEPGDAYRFRGRGYTQLTGRDNYEAASKDLGIDLVNNPDLAASPEVAAKIATWYWQKREGLSEAAQRGDHREVTRLINGGHNGLEDRLAATYGYLGEAQAGKLTAEAREVDADPVKEAIADPVPEVEASPEPVSNAQPGGKPADPFDTGDGTYPFTYEELVERSILRSAYAQERDRQTAAAEAAAAVPVPSQPTLPAVPAVEAAPVVRAPISSPSAGKNQPQAAAHDVSRDVPDRRIAHIVTGGYSGGF